MGTQAIKIIKTDVEQLITLLNKAFADEWLAYYQYWMGAKVIDGPMRNVVITELIQHATDELRHSDMLANKIIQLGGTPILEPKEWYEMTNCGYSAPKDFYVEKILNQNIKGEQCAIEVYNKIVNLTKDKDIETYNMVTQILRDEVEHEDDLQKLLEDLHIMLKR